MPDKNFHKRDRSFTLCELAERSGATLAPGSDPAYTIEDVAPLDMAGPGDLSFLDNVKYKSQFTETRAGACIVHPDLAALAPAKINILLSPVPYRAYALAAQSLYPEKISAGTISAAAYIDPSVRLGQGCVVEAGAVIKAGAHIGDSSWIESGAVIGESVEIGSHCRIGLNACITHSIIGNHVRVYPGACIGQDGFGFSPSEKGPVKIPQLGRVLIGNNVEIGANCAIDRGSGPDTVIGEGTWIDNLVQIAHNVKIGRFCIITGQCGIAGSAVLEDFVTMGGQSGISGHLKIGKGARIAAQAGVIGNLDGGTEYMGFPAQPAKDFLRQIAMLKRLIKREKGS